MSDYDRFEKIFCGTWKLDRIENMEEFWDSVGTPGDIRRTSEAALKATMTYVRTGSKVINTMEVGPKKFDVPFVFGEEFEFIDKPEDPKVHAKVVASMKGDTMIHSIFNVLRGTRYTNDCTVTGDVMTFITSHNDVKMKRIYKRA